jgi:multimeric flavodoxin WrbA
MTADGYHLSSHIEQVVTQAGCLVQTTVIPADSIKPCLGCFGCWVKTPGLCVITDDEMNRLAGELVRSDAVILVSRLTYGGFSADIKAFLDRSIPNISPLMEVFHGQMHHRMRYRRFPCWIAFGYGDSTEQERRLFQVLTERNALNMRPNKYFCLTVPDDDACAGALQTLRLILAEEVRTCSA